MLILPFGLVGLVGGGLTAEVLGLAGAGRDWSLRAPLVLVTPAICALLGAFLQSELRRGPLTVAATLGMAAVAAGALNGAIVGLFAAPPWGALLGLGFGVVWALPFVPFLGLVVAVARRALEARAGSVLQRAERRGVWRATAVVIAIASLIGALGTRHGDELGIWRAAAGASFVLAALLVAFDVHALRRIVALSESLRSSPSGRWRPLDPAARELDLGAGHPVVDLGVGKGTLVAIAPPGQAYRSAERVERTLRGNLGEACAFARASALVGAGSLAVCATALVIQLRS